MAKISVLVVLLLLLLAVATESSSIVRSPAAAVETDDDEEARTIRVKSLDRIREIFGGLPDRLEKILDKFFPPKDGEERSARRSGAVAVVKAGNTKFSALVVDVTSAVTWTSQCGGGGQRRLRCGDPLCKQYGGEQKPSCGGAAQACIAGKDALLRGNFSLSMSAGERVVFSGEDTVYACSPGENSGGGGGYAIIGLGRRSVVANSSMKFSYLISNDLRRSFVWLGDDAVAAQGGRKSTTTKLISVADGNSPDMDPSLYYVNITGINVGDRKVTGNAAATAILTTTMPFTFLNPALFDDLNQELRATTAAASEGSSSDFDGQLCYPKGTKLPAITLTFAGKDASMKLEAEHYSYEKSNGVVCLSILRSRLRGGVSVVGSMLQAGRRMTYDLDDDTVTFDFEAALAASPRLTSPSSSRSSSAAAKAAVTPVVLLISSALIPLLLANIM